MLPPESVLSLFHALPGIHLIVKPDFPRFTIAAFTDAFLKTTEFTREEVEGRGIFEVFPLKPVDALVNGPASLSFSLFRAIEQKVPQRMPVYKHDMSIPHADACAGKFWSVLNTPHLDASGDVNYIILSLEDVTANIRAAEKEKQALLDLEKNAQYYDSLFHDNPDPVFSFDEEGKFLSANNALAELLECSLEEIHAMTFVPFVAPEDLDKTLAHFQAALKGIPQHYEVKVVTAKGNSLFVSITNLPILVDQKIIGVYGIAKNISDRKLAEQILLSEKEKYRTIVDHSQDALFLGLPDGTILDSNPAASLIFGYTPAEFRMLRRQDLMDHSDSRLIQGLQQRKDMGCIKEELTGIRKNGERFPIEVSSVIFRDENGEERSSNTISDISIRKSSENDVLRSGALLQQAEALAHFGSWERDLFTGKVTWSDEFFRICGFEPRSFEPSFEKRIEVAHPEDAEQMRAVFQDVVETGSEYFIQNRIIRPDGNVRVVLSKGKLIKDALGRPLRQIGVIQDITEKMTASEALRSSEQKYRTVFENSPLPKWIYDMNSLCFLEVNDAAVQHYGYSREEFLQMTIKDIRPREDIPLLMQDIYAANPSLSRLLGPYRHKKKNGELIQVELTGVTIDYSGLKARMIVCNDITQKLNFQDALLKSNERLDYAMKASFDAIWDWELDSNQVYRGQGYKDLFGHDYAECESSIGEWHHNIHPEDRHAIMESIDRALRECGKSWAGQYRYRRSDNTYAYVNDRGIIIRDVHGNPYRMIGAMQDITRQKTEEQEREKLIEELIRNNQDLQQFSYITSHNLKSPLANLLAIHSILDISEIRNAETLTLLDGLRKSTYQLNETIADLINILVIKKNVNHDTTLLDLNEVWQKTEKVTMGITGSTETRVIIDFSRVSFMHFNQAYLESIFLNLVSNAIKYRSPHRKLRVEISSSEDKDFVILAFRDNGLGIDLARHGKKIFGLYQRFHNHPDSRGLGLYMVSSQVKALGGKIEVESRLNEGTCFTVYFPKKESLYADNPQSEAHSLLSQTY